MSATVKCKDCGYLAVRSTQTRQLLDAEDTFRDKGYIPQIDLDYRGKCWAYDDFPVCFANEISFRSDDEIGKVSDSETRLRAIHKDRPCLSFTPWKQGFTPKEHAEMLQEEARLKWQESREDADRAWRERQDEKAENRHRDNLRAVSLAGWTNVWSAIGAALLGGIVGAWATNRMSVRPAAAPLEPLRVNTPQDEPTVIGK